MLEDRILIRQSQRGDQQAFDRIYTKYLDMLLTVAHSLLGQRHEAEDVVQDVFVKLVESLDDLRLRGSLKGFLAVCVANRAKDRLRSRTRQVARDQNRPASDLYTSPLDNAVQSEAVLKAQQGATATAC